jgi:hypothetical protein
MSAPDFDRAEHIKQLRPLAVQALHAIVPRMPLVDCARIVNAAIDSAEDGDLRSVHGLRDLLQRALDASDKAEAEGK